MLESVSLHDGCPRHPTLPAPSGATFACEPTANTGGGKQLPTQPASLPPFPARSWVKGDLCAEETPSGLGFVICAMGMAMDPWRRRWCLVLVVMAIVTASFAGVPTSQFLGFPQPWAPCIAPFTDEGTNRWRRGAAPQPGSGGAELEPEPTMAPKPQLQPQCCTVTWLLCPWPVAREAVRQECVPDWLLPSTR